MRDPSHTEPDAPVGDWRERALCRQLDQGDLFFPEKGASAAPAKSICVRCPVQVQCLEYALANNERYGVWGGMSERNRRKLSRGERPQQPDTCGNGHDLTLVGIYGDGQCRECRREYNRSYKARKATA